MIPPFGTAQRDVADVLTAPLGGVFHPYPHKHADLYCLTCQATAVYCRCLAWHAVRTVEVCGRCTMTGGIPVTEEPAA